jgi:phage terminase large subunit-like protein
MGAYESTRRDCVRLVVLFVFFTKRQPHGSVYAGGSFLRT